MRSSGDVDLTTLTEDELRTYLQQLADEEAATRRRLTHPDALRRAARWYAARGIPVFPLRPGGKTPLFPKAHPDDPTRQAECRGRCGRVGHGLHDATTNPEQVDAWWRTHPAANIGLRTGVTVDVIDIDGPTGYQTWAVLVTHGACPPGCCDTRLCPGDGGVTLRTITRRVLGVAHTAGDNGGRHIYIPTNGAGGNRAAALPGVDYRGAGGYVVAPPSHGRRGQYTWTTPLTV